MEQNELEHQKWVHCSSLFLTTTASESSPNARHQVTQYNEMFNKNAGKKIIASVTLIADAA